MTQPWTVLEFNPKAAALHRTFWSEDGPMAYILWQEVRTHVDTPEFYVIEWPSGWWQIWVKR